PIILAAKKGKRGRERTCARAGDDFEQGAVAACAPADQQTRAEGPVFLSARESQQVVGELRPFTRQRLPDLLFQGLAVVAIEASIADANKRNRPCTERQGVQSRIGTASGKPQCGADHESAVRFAQL